MAKEDVVVRMSAEDAQLVAAWQRARKGPEAMGNELDKFGQKSKRTQQDSSTGLEKMIAKWGGVATAIGAATAALHGYMETNERRQREHDEATLTTDDLARRFFSTSKIFDKEEQRAAVANIKEATLETGVLPQQSFPTAEALASAGFSKEQILGGGGLTEMLRMQAGLGEKGRNVDITEATKALVGFSKATGISTDAAGIRRIGEMMSGLSETAVEFKDLQDLAGEAGSVGAMAHLSPEQIASEFAVLRDKAMPAGDAATGLRNVVGRLTTAGANKTRMKALDMIGLKPEDVDTVGETWETALARLKKGLSGVDEATQNVVLTKLFEERGQASARFLLEGRDQVAASLKSIEEAKDTYQARIDLGEAGPAVEQRRAEAQKQFRESRPDEPVTQTTRLKLEDQIREGKEGALFEWLQMQTFDLYKKLGADDETAYGAARTNFGKIGDFGGTTPMETLQRDRERRRQREAEREAAPGSRDTSSTRIERLLEKQIQATTDMRREIAAAGRRPQRFKLDADGTQRNGRRLPEQLNDREMA